MKQAWPELDEIDWHSLRHAYGTAEDVPELLRNLRTAKPSATWKEKAPLSQLFSNIWHQGTVYDATAYAVPFLIQLVADPATPDRVGILGLLSAIAEGSSFLDVHADYLQMYPSPDLGVPGSAKFEEKRAVELEWVNAAHTAVAQGYEQYAELTKDFSDVAYATANVLACLEVETERTYQILVEMLRAEDRPLYRAGLILLLPSVGRDSDELPVILNRYSASEEVVERHASAAAVARLKKCEISEALQQAIVEAIFADYLEEFFEGLPWDASGYVSCDALLRRDPIAASIATSRLLELAEDGKLNADSFDKLFELLFERKESLQPEELSNEQQRALVALVNAMDEQDLRYGLSYSVYGLPDSRRKLRRLAAGLSIEIEVDETLPVIGDATDPKKPLAIWRLSLGDRIHSKYFGFGTVRTMTRKKRVVQIVIDTDEEGCVTLGLEAKKLRYFIDRLRYEVRRILRPPTQPGNDPA